MKLIGYTVVYNEEKMVPYVAPYILKMGYDKFIVYDDGCTDNTIEMLMALSGQGLNVEVRETPKRSEGFEGRKRDAELDSFLDCCNIAEEFPDESVWMSFTDFDEVLYCGRERENTFKENLKLYDESGYNYFDGRMLHLSWDGKKKDSSLPHQWKGVRGTWWLFEGCKPTLFNVRIASTVVMFCGNHHMGVKLADGVQLKALNGIGEFHGFHLKYFDRTILGERRDKLVESAENANDTIRHNSFPLDMYFLFKGFFAEKTKMNKRNAGEGLFVF